MGCSRLLWSFLERGVTSGNHYSVAFWVLGSLLKNTQNLQVRSQRAWMSPRAGGLRLGQRAHGEELLALEAAAMEAALHLCREVKPQAGDTVTLWTA